MKKMLLILVLSITSQVLASAVPSQPTIDVQKYQQRAIDLKNQVQQIQNNKYKDNINNKLEYNSNVKNENFSSGSIMENFDLPFAIGLFIIAALLLTWLFWPSRVATLKKSPLVSMPAVTDDEGEFDYLNSDEAIPAKIDLARAYIDMGEFSNAREILADIRHRGNSEQQQAAQSLLSKI